MSKRSAKQETANLRAAPTTVKRLAFQAMSLKTLAILAPLSAAMVAGPLSATAATPKAASLATLGAASSQALHVSIQDGKVDLQARDVSLATVLEALAAEAGYEIEIYGEPTSPATSWTLDDVPVAKALFRLAGDNSFVLSPVGPRGAQILKVYGPAARPTAAPPSRPRWPARTSTATSGCRSCTAC